MAPRLLSAEMCGINFFYCGSVLEKNSDSVQFEFGSIGFKNLGSLWILQLFTTHVIANIITTVDDMTLTSLMSLTTTTTGK